MKGNFQVRFLGGKGGVTRPTYPTIYRYRQSKTEQFYKLDTLMF